MRVNMHTSIAGIKVCLLLLLNTLAWCYGAKAQTAGNKYQLSYTETVKTSFAVPDQQTAAKLTALDKVGFTQTEKIQNVSVVQNGSDDITTTYTIVKDETRKSWMPPVSKIIIDKTGIVSFGPDGKITSQTTAEANYTREYTDLKSEVAAAGPGALYAVRMPDAKALSQLAADGFTVQTRDNITVIKSPDAETVINGVKNTVTHTDYAGGKITYEQQIQFQQGTSGLRPALRLEKIYDTTSSGLCYIKLIQTTFSNYQEQLP